VSGRAKIAAGAATAVAGAAAGVTLRERGRRLRQRVESDPARAVLARPLEGEPLEVFSADGTPLHAQVFGPERTPAVAAGGGGELAGGGEEDGGSATEPPTIVLVHGWTCAMAFWTLQIHELRRDHRVVAFDLRGHGRSAEPAGGDYSIEALAADLDAVLESTLPDGQRALVAGHSMGGMTLVAWAGLRHAAVADRLAAAALVNTGVGGLIAEALVIRSPAALERTRDALGRALLAAPGPLPTRPNPLTYEAIRYLTLGPDASAATAAFCERMVLACAPDTRARCGATMSRLDLSRSLASLDVPTLVIAGERDRLTPPVHARRMVEELPAAGYVELPRTGHMAPLERPAEVGRTLRELAAGRPARGRERVPAR
jgi:pimeloyl-ACP methyl ester carboxylesterase